MITKQAAYRMFMEGYSVDDIAALRFPKKWSFDDAYRWVEQAIRECKKAGL